jgi:sulfoxide reductase heme-binding subunit YedZ
VSIVAPPLSAPVVAGPSLLWYATRATGVVAMVLLTATVMLGVAGTARAASARWPRIVTAGLHRNLALTSVALVAVHVVTTVLDPFAPIGWIAAVIPFSSPYRPLWLSLGAVAFDLLLAVLVTSLLRDRLKHRTWQAVHLLVYASWPVALWHGLGTGTDTPLPWLLVVYAGCVAGVGWAIWWRLTLSGRRAGRAAGLTAVAVVPLLTLAFVLAGPLQPGWSRRSGTPVALLGGNIRAPAGQPAASGQPARLVNARFTGRLTIVAGPSADERTITITGSTTAAPRERLLIVLHGTPSGEGVALSGGQVRIGQPGTVSEFAGPVVLLQGRQLVAAVTGTSGQRRAQFVLTVRGSAVTGTVSLLAAAQD